MIEKLMVFCHKRTEEPLHSIAESLLLPFSEGGKTYSSDGHILVRADGELAPTRTDSTRIPDVTIFPWEVKSGEMVVVIAEELFQHRRPGSCKACAPNGGGVLECQECNGDGLVSRTSNGGYEYEADCAVCHGAGTVGVYNTKDCPRCYGTKEKRDQRPWRLFDGLFVDFFYLMLITSTLGNATFYRPHRGSTENPAIYFTCNGADGFLMPMKHDEGYGFVNEERHAA